MSYKTRKAKRAKRRWEKKRGIGRRAKQQQPEHRYRRVDR